MNEEPPAAARELQAWPHWVVWRAEQRENKTTKVPYCAFSPSRKASSTDPETWGTYEQAADAVERGRADGIGYVFAPDDEYLGIDLDGCVTNGRITDEAMAIVHALASYTEISPTGTGLHIYIRAGMKGSRRRKGQIECYDQGRFFTFTGNHLPGTPETIEARQAEFDEFYTGLFPPEPKASNGSRPRVPVPDSDHDLLERIRKSKQAATFERLWRGEHDGDDSAADLGLCNIFAFWTGGDEARIDSLFRQSGLYRDKWDERRGETTYGHMTVDKSLEGRTEFYRPGGGKPAGARPADDDVAKTPGEEISAILGLIDDPLVSGWRSGRSAKSRVVLTTRAGAVLDLESWKSATSSPPVLSQEIGLQLGIEVVLKKENISRLNVLIGKFCELAEAATIRDRARELGEAFLQEAEKWPVDMNDQASRHTAFVKLQDTSPTAKAKAEGISMVAACIVLTDTSGKRYVRVQWFVDYVKATAVSGTVGPILEQMEAPGWWSRPNSQSKFKATDPSSGKAIFQRLFEVPAEWEGQ